MLTPKALIFIKRTARLLCPLPAFTFGLKVFATSDGLYSFTVPVGNNSDEIHGDGKAIKLATSASLPAGTVDKGSIVDIGSLSLEQMNPFNSDFLGITGEFWYKEAKIRENGVPIQSNEITFEKEDDSDGKNKYILSLDSYESSVLKGKGDLHLVSEVVVALGGKEIPLLTVIPLQDLIYEHQKEHEIFKVTDGQSSSDLYNFQITKNNETKNLELKLEKKDTASSRKRRSVGVSQVTEENIKVKTFYFIFTLTPPLDYTKIFKQEQESERVGEISQNYSVKRQIHLSNWKNKTGGAASDQSHPKYDLNKTTDFWKSICRDPFKVGGWIDESLVNNKKSTSDDTLKSKDSTNLTHIKNQMESWEEFKVGFNVKPKPTKQYYWEEDSFKKSPYGNIPSTDYTTPSPCENMDDGTKELYKEFTAEDKILDHEPEGSNRITSIPDIKYFQDIKNGTTPSSSQDPLQYPIHKVIQSSFRAWGNGIPSKTGNPMKENIFDSFFEESLQTEHIFTLKIDKDTVIANLIEHSKLKAEKDMVTEKKKFNEIPQVSSLLKINVPFSYSVYDPLANYFKKNRILITMDLDLRSIYNQSYSNKTIFTRNLDGSHSIIGYDHKGQTDSTTKDNPYGISGILEFASSLYHDLNGDVFVDIITKTKGFVNTKNTDCDLRHRVYKWKTTNTKCFDEESSSNYRKHNHIPSFLIVTLEKDPSVNSFYIDRTSSITNSGTSSSGSRTKRSAVPAAPAKKTEINTLSEFKTKISNPEEVRKTTEMDKSNNGEVFFKDSAVYSREAKGDKKGQRNELYSWGWTSWNYYDQIHYFKPRKTFNKLVLKEIDNLTTLVLFLGGSDTLASYFFSSGHHSTMMTLCYSNKLVESTAPNKQECADGKKYENIQKDKKSSDLVEIEGNQKIELEWSKIKEKNSDSDPLKINFRTLIHSELDISDNGDKKFDTNKTKYEQLFKEDAVNITTSNKTQIPKFSFLGVWYTLELWYEAGSKTLHYSTLLRPISHVPEPPTNEKNQIAIGAAGSAGFQIINMEFVYKKSTGGTP